MYHGFSWSLEVLGLEEEDEDLEDVDMDFELLKAVFMEDILRFGGIVEDRGADLLY